MKKLFLLGGQDLETEEIKTLLLQHGAYPYPNDDAREGIFFCDKALGWGAKLSDYGECLDFDGEIYGIELIEDITPPPNYRAIDHHGKFWCRPSALEQMAELLDVELNRWQRLVAANDKGHIAALKAMGATPEEIEKIREADMKAQGVTDEEKAQARREAKSVEKRGNVYYVETTLAHTSPLVDMLIQAGKTPLIVVNKERKNLTYYGDGVLKLAGKFQAEIDGNKAYYGGNPPGYFGFAPKYFDHSTYDEAVESIAQTLQEATMHSYHIFMLPFSVKKQKGQKNERFEVSAPWVEKLFDLSGEEAARNYSEYTYFYDYVREVLYNTEAHKENLISRYFEHTEGENGYYDICTSKKCYRLKLDGIALRHFQNGIGILSLHLINDTYASLDDILKINDFGRRIYPQYLGDKLVETTKENLLACELVLSLGDTTMREDFGKYAKQTSLANNPIHQLPVFITSLLKEAYGKKSTFEPVIDDRMYVICHYLNDCISEKLTAYDKEKNSYAYENGQEWHRFVFVDGGDSTCQNRHMLKNLLEKATYPRWSDYGTLFGVTRYSFMLLTKQDWFAQNILNLHIRTLYYQMATLLLAYRAMILEFSHQVSHVLNKKENGSAKHAAEKLFRKYLEFQNRIYFKEITAQEQGIELFDTARSQMRLDYFLNELDHDIAELHDFIQLKIEDERNEQAMTLNRIAAVFLPPTLLAGMFGMNMIDFSTSPAMAALSVVMIFISGVIGYFIADSKKKKKLLGAFLIVILAAPIFGYIIHSAVQPQTSQQQSPVKESHAAKK